MLSNDELSYGMPFILEMRADTGEPLIWIETLRGDTARHWYEIYRDSDWKALRLEAPGVFHRRVTADEARRVSRSCRCIVIKTNLVSTPDLQASATTPNLSRHEFCQLNMSEPIHPPQMQREWRGLAHHTDDKQTDGKGTQ